MTDILNKMKQLAMQVVKAYAGEPKEIRKYSKEDGLAGWLIGEQRHKYA